MKKRIMLVLIIVLAMPMILLAVGQDETKEETTVIRVRTGWPQDRLPNWDSRIAKFMEINPDIQIDIQYTFGGPEAIQKLRTDFMIGEAPEVLQTWKTDFNEYVAEGLLREMSDFYDDTGMDDLFYPASLGWAAPLLEARSGKSVYGIPDFPAASVFFYNIDIFEEAGLSEPNTLEELLDTIDKLEASGKRGLIIDGQHAGGMDLVCKAQVQTAGLQPLLDVNSGNGKFTDPPFIEAGKIVEKIANKIDPVSLTIDSAGAGSMFGAGEAAIFSYHSGMIPVIEKAAKVSGVNWSVFKEVKLVPDPKVLNSVTYGGVFVTPKANENWRETYKFLEYIFSEESVKETAKITGFMTNMPEANKELTDPVIRKILDNHFPSATVESFYMIDMVPSKVLWAFVSGVQEIIQGTTDAAGLMEMAQQAFEESQM